MYYQWIPELNGYCQDQSIDFDIRKQKAKEIGREIHKAGGFKLMVQVNDYQRSIQSRPGAARLIEQWWDGIGKWRG